MASTSTPSPPRTARDMLERAREFLARKHVPEARLDAELLVAHALGINRLGLFLALDRPLQEAEISLARELLVRRGKREPTAFLVGRREFFGRDFLVGPGVLIPRPETELLVDLARERAGDRSGLEVLDLGTGSGCLAVTLALELDGPRVTASDISPLALGIARKNAEALGADIEFIEGDGLSPFDGRSFDLVVSNPPYVDPACVETLEPEVREHEPAEALFAPEGDPDHWARRLLAAVPDILVPGGVLLVELGFDQADRLRADGVVIHDDLAGIPRVLEVVRP